MTTIPLWKVADSRALRNLIWEACPLWKDILIRDRGKYLGFLVGPGSGDQSWDAPLAKFEARTNSWCGTKAGLLWNSIYYNTFIVTTLEYVAQLSDVPMRVIQAEQAALRKLAPGPGNWISEEDLENLACFSIGNGFRTIQPTAKASKLRLMRDLGIRNIRKSADSIKMTQLESWRRPFGAWHASAYAMILCSNWKLLVEDRLVIDLSAKDCQKKHLARICSLNGRFDLENSIRYKVGRWGFSDPPGIVARRLAKHFTLFKVPCPPQQ